MAETLCTNAEAKLHAGTYYDTNLTAGNWTTFINEAEGMLCVDTNYNWLDVYATLDADIKQVLQLGTAVLAANMAIKYNMNNYLDLAEAQTLMNVNDELYSYVVKRLKEDQSRRFLIRGTNQ